jgi:anti-sigma regulatory factor (Ser/Thr protein kinase)
VIPAGSLHLEMRAVVETSPLMRQALRAFLDALEVGEPLRSDILTAIGEALANAIEHAYRDKTTGPVRLTLKTDVDGRLNVEIADDGAFREPLPATMRGFGLRIIRAVAESVEIDQSGGTAIRMIFALR